MIAAFPSPDWDYRCYVNAAVLLDQGKSPYSPELGTQYLYPPPVAHVFRFLRSVLPNDGVLFGVDQSVQLVLLAAAYFLTATLARRLGIGDRLAYPLAASMVILNYPILYTLRHHNTNLLLLDAVLLAMLFPRAAASGLVLAAATMLKLYPAFLLLPLWVFGYRRIAMWWAIGMLLPLLSGGVRHDWPAFIDLLPDMPKGEAVLDNSVTSAIERAWRASGAHPPRAIVSGIAAVVGIAALSLLLVRLHRARFSPDRDHAFLRSCAEWASVVLLLSPIAWPEHFALALPLAVVLLAEDSRRTAALAGIALVLLLPRTGLYPYSHHFLAGLILLLSLAPPYRRGLQTSQR